MRTSFTLLVSLFTGLMVYGQSSIHYEPLRSVGPVPAEFSRYTDEAIGQLANTKENAFERNARIRIHELITSGYVLFGDDISRYINTLGQEILAANHLSDSLRFYVLRSTDFNAFSTDQGVIFITIGAIAGSETREELAFVMCHEIAHYLSHHNYETYQRAEDLLQTKNRNEPRVAEQMAELFKYSRQNELAADSLGAQLFLQCGYRNDRLIALKSLYNLNTYEMAARRLDWKPSYLEDSLFQFPAFYDQLTEWDKRRYRHFYTTKEMSGKRKRRREVESEDPDHDFRTHPDFEERYSALQRQIDISDDSVQQFVSAVAKADAAFVTIQHQCEIENIFLLMAATRYIEAHYQTQITKHRHGLSNELYFLQTLTLNDIYWHFFSHEFREPALLPFWLSPDSASWNISHMTRFFAFMSADEWGVILCRENFNLLELNIHPDASKHYFNLSASLAKSAVSSKFSGFCKTFEEKTLDDVFDEDETIEDEDAERFRHRYLKSAFLIFQDDENRETKFERSRSEDLENQTELYTRSMVGLRFLNRTQFKTSWLRKTDTLIIMSPAIKSFRYRKGDYTPTSWLDEQYSNEVYESMQYAGSRLGMHILPINVATRSELTAQIWNDHILVESWLAEKLLSNSQQIIPVYALFTHNMASQYGSNPILYTHVMIANNGLKDRKLVNWLTPVTFPYLLARKIGRPASQVLIFNAVIDIQHNEIRFVQIETLQHAFTSDFRDAQVYDLLYQTKRHLNLPRIEHAN
ncbi:MAG: M48 family metalloprotease [Flavobacteriales bacterium]|nr:M48 family metalloprotease [Flavobacteriales bacterium]